MHPGNPDVCVGIGDTSFITPNGQIKLFHLVTPEQVNGMSNVMQALTVCIATYVAKHSEDPGSNPGWISIHQITLQ